MRSVQMNINVSGTKELAELNHHTRDEEKEIRDGVVGEGQGLSEEDESRINNEDMEVRDNGHVRGVQARAVIQRPQQQPQGPVVRWERFLPVRSLKVLLVENDDSTRHVVSALLRNCGYEVTAVANGLLAWRILKDLPNHIDLILTEVVMPTLSGIGLLCKIMSHKTCKNIPVIMMSSHDSLGIVFKCLSKGAVDFLVKPIRKNELKNLWQHVWRKCHSSSGSGSESGVGTRRSTRSGNAEETDNNSGSNEENGNWSNGLNVRDGSDHGSGTQSSWTKRAVEVDSPQPMLPWDQLADPPDSTCAQVIHSRAEAFGNNWEPMTATRECQLRNNELENSAMHKDLEVREPKNLDLQRDPSEKVLSNITGSNKDKLLGLDLKKDDNQFEKEPLVLRGGEPNGEQRNRSEDQMDVAANRTDPQIERSTIDLSKLCASKDGTIYDTKELPSLELSLKRLRDIEDIGTSTHDRNVLRHSNLSAFSRYNSASTGNQAPTGNVGSCSQLDNSPNATKTESMQNFQSNYNGTLPNQHSTGSSNKNDMGSTTNNAFTKPATFNDKSALKSTLKFMNPSSVFQPEKNGHLSPLQSVKPGKADGVTDDTGLTQGREMQQQVQVQHHHHHYHHHHHHVHKLQQQQQQNLLSDDDLSSKSMAAAALQCGSSNALRAPIEGNGMIHSLNGSASGSNHGSNGQNCSNIAVNNGGVNVESDNGIAPKDEAGGASGSGSGSGVDQNRFVGRVAALDKFRQKRKQRCFEKKVRYQSRKKLAEQRPRVRGQFVRQVAYESKSKDTNS